MLRMITLQVYVADDCWACDETRRIVAEIAPEFPDIQVELLDMRTEPHPENVFAVPTYLLNGRVISLGNPHRADLRARLVQARIQT